MRKDVDGPDVVGDAVLVWNFGQVLVSAVKKSKSAVKKSNTKSKSAVKKEVKKSM